EIPQYGNRKLDCETGRHLYPECTLCGSTVIADIIERVLEAIEGFHHRRQQMLAGLRQGQSVRFAVEELHTHQTLERNDVARQRALGDQQRVRRSREAAVLRDALESSQGIQWQPAPIDALFAHGSLRSPPVR